MINCKKTFTSYQERRLSPDSCKYMVFSLYRDYASKKLNVFYLYLSSVLGMCAKFSNLVVEGLYINAMKFPYFP